jgi:sugar transferase (PEP-CTERM/EpsH1 system associated)
MVDERPLVMHLVFSFDVGGLENGIVNLINRMDPALFRHMVVALSHCSPGFCSRVQRDDVEFISLEKAPGHGVKLYPKLYSLFKQYRPSIVHSRNLAALEAVVPARAAGVPVRIHGEHGWDVSDPGGTRVRYRLMRRLYRPFVSHYVALSAHLADYLVEHVHVPESRLTRICNGVDTTRFHAATEGRELLEGSPFNASDLTVVGTVGRLQAVKDQVTLVRAFALSRSLAGAASDKLRLCIAGDGPLRREVEEEIVRAGVGSQVWLAGTRGDVPDVMRGLDLFVLPSRAEGISNTILEAMATGLAVIATNVGGNAELVLPGETGALVPAGDPAAMSEAIAQYAADGALRREHGLAGRLRVESEFSLDGMVERYALLYQSQLEAACARRAAA